MGPRKSVSNRAPHLLTPALTAVHIWLICSNRKFYHNKRYRCYRYTPQQSFCHRLPNDLHCTNRPFTYVSRKDMPILSCRSKRTQLRQIFLNEISRKSNLNCNTAVQDCTKFPNLITNVHLQLVRDIINSVCYQRYEKRRSVARGTQGGEDSLGKYSPPWKSVLDIV